jgi:hypothetical protein
MNQLIANPNVSIQCLQDIKGYLRLTLFTTYLDTLTEIMKSILLPSCLYNKVRYRQTLEISFFLRILYHIYILAKN